MKTRIIDGYSEKLLNSGYSLEKSREIVIRGIKGYESKVLRCKKEGAPLRKTAASREQRRNY